MFQLLPLIFGAASIAYNLGKDYLQGKRDKESQSLAQDNLDLNKIVATNNYDLAKQQFEYQKELNQTIMDREDTSMQRQIADLKAAGMSPLVAAGGASATPLTSANAPQMDLSGVNIAMGNMLSAYNDIFNRRMTRQQFRLNAALQTADAYNKIAEAKLQRKYLGLQADYLDAELKYNNDHGFRDLNWRSELTRLAESLLGYNGSSVIPYPGNINGLPNLEGVAAALGSPANPAQLFNSPSFSYKLPITPQQIKSDTKKLISQEKADYQNASDLLFNFQDKEYQQSALSYFYRYTDAWRDYEYLDDFRKALLNAKDKGKFLSKYPYIERKPLNLGR